MSTKLYRVAPEPARLRKRDQARVRGRKQSQLGIWVRVKTQVRQARQRLAGWLTHHPGVVSLLGVLVLLVTGQVTLEGFVYDLMVNVLANAMIQEAGRSGEATKTRTECQPRRGKSRAKRKFRS